MTGFLKSSILRMGTVIVLLSLNRNFPGYQRTSIALLHNIQPKYLLDNVRTTLVLHREVTQQRVSAHIKDCAELKAARAVGEIEFCRFLADMQAKIDLNQTFPDDG